MRTESPSELGTKKGGAVASTPAVSLRGLELEELDDDLRAVDQCFSFCVVFVREVL